MSARKILLATGLSVALVVPALAQTTAPAPTAPAPAAPPAAPMAPPTTQPAPAPSPNTSPAPVTDMFYRDTLAPTHWRASEAVGQAVYNNADEKIGDISELLIDGDGRVLAAVIGVGGFLGIGQRDVAVSFRSLQITRDANGRPKLVVNIDKATLESAPEYKPEPAPARS